MGFPSPLVRSRVAVNKRPIQGNSHQIAAPGFFLFSTCFFPLSLHQWSAERLQLHSTAKRLSSERHLSRYQGVSTASRRTVDIRALLHPWTYHLSTFSSIFFTRHYLSCLSYYSFLTCSFVSSSQAVGSSSWGPTIEQCYAIACDASLS